MSPHTDIAPDQEHALAAATRNLADDFAGVFNRETIERFLAASYDRLAARASFEHFLPLMAERFARQHLRVLAKVEGRAAAGTPTVLFLCVQNAGRSQMALGWFNHLVDDQAIGWSGGSEPGDDVNPMAVEVMAEIGIDIRAEYPKPWTDEIVRVADVVITMGCGDACPLFPGTRYEDWPLADPAGWRLDEVRAVRDEIGDRVRALVVSLGIEAKAR